MTEESKETPLHPTLGKEAEAAIQEELQTYLEEKGLNALFQKMIQDLLLAKPDNPIDFLTTSYPEKSSTFKSKISSGKVSMIQMDEEEPDEDFSEEESGEDDFDEEAERKFNERSLKKSSNGATRRISVSAAVLNAEALDSEIKSYPKSEEDQKLLQSYLDKNILCGHLGKEEKRKIVGAFEKADVAADEEIITQGDIVTEYYFIIGSGTANVVKNGDVVLEYKAGDAFGELALMYNAPRAATVKAIGQSSVWRLDQRVFKTILMGNAIKARERRTQILSKVDILKEMAELEKQKLVEALKPRIFKAGEIICSQGDAGDEFFIISEGEVDVVVNEQNLGDLKEGEYFGEISLLTNKPRQATIKAKTESVTLLVVHRKVFKRLLGPLSDILKRNMKTYSEYVAGVKIG